MNPGALLRDLIAIPSVSSESNLAVIRYAQTALARIGWEWEELPYADDRGVAKVNLVAYPKGHLPRQIANQLALVCHTDTVPYDWPEALTPIERDYSLWGRGACDVKGFLACALSAIDGIYGPVCLVLTADEEIGCIGARRLAEAAVVRPRYAIIGEPTSLMPVRAGKGYCLATLTCTGREAHSAFPERGESAITKAARVVLDVARIADELRAEQDEAFDPPFTTVNIGTIQGGRAKNVIPGECSMLLEWRPIPNQSAERVTKMITGCEVRIERLQPGFETLASSPLVQLLSELTGRAPGTVSFGTEAPWINRLGAEAVVFGPGDMRVAHSRDEHVPIGELDQCASILRAALKRLSAD